jgi:hypothetical protein
VELLHPSASFQPHMKRRGVGEDAGENNRSLVLKLTYGAISVLFTGDIEQEAESFLLQTGHDLRATILKVPHHGSRTSSSEAFVRAVNPSVAVISVQRDSRFGHPHPAVVERYRRLGALILRTDEFGAITIRTDGQSVWVEPFVGRPVALSAPVTHRLVETLTSPSPAPARRRTSAGRVICPLRRRVRIAEAFSMLNTLSRTYDFRNFRKLL